MFRDKSKKQNNSGFSLIEILIAMVILFLIIGGVVTFSVRTIQSHMKSQAMQNSIENARFAIEGLNKRIRTSHNIEGNESNFTDKATEIFIVDNVDGEGYCYKFEENVLKVAHRSDGGDYNNCSELVSGGAVFEELIGDVDDEITVSGGFYVKETDTEDSNPDKTRGFVRTVITIYYGAQNGRPEERDSFTIQSSVSLRDYGTGGGS